MLDSHYTDRFSQLVKQVDWTIQLPDPWDDFFTEHGEGNQFVGDVRQHRRLKARSYGVAWIGQAWAAVERPAGPLGIYTRDFSQRGCGLLAPVEIYPEEVIRVVLPTFWMTLQVVRCRRVNGNCYDVGSALVRQYVPSDEAFQLWDETSSSPVAC